MLNLRITKEQVFSLLEQLSWQEKQDIFQYLGQKLHSQAVASQSNLDHALEHPINQLSGKITAFQGVNALAWQEQIRSEWDETGLSH
ncbi:hypothetical protein NWP21_06450 [Anabaenopsis sp. FSS-46]|uniref:hypothetical protein n=1 Tax=Anabaenopsis sp. FSS-46 TaxID=2971766 RepID=UPI002474F5C5|nr:hypothetical protein [Anabaenopsis sp. FSS-46]MDH6098489.1 hypothetical protein [Anabaenopsis sp. FSS-46]